MRLSQLLFNLYMNKFLKKNALKNIGEKLRLRRMELELKPNDIAEMSGFTYNTIRNIENGHDTMLSCFIEVCMALNVQPVDIIGSNYNLVPRFELSAARKEKSRLTARINLFYEKGFFKEYRSSREVVDKILNEYDVKTTSSTVSVILNRLAKIDLLKIKKEKGKNFYIMDKNTK